MQGSGGLFCKTRSARPDRRRRRRRAPSNARRRRRHRPAARRQRGSASSGRAALRRTERPRTSCVPPDRMRARSSAFSESRRDRASVSSRRGAERNRRAPRNQRAIFSTFAQPRARALCAVRSPTQEIGRRANEATASPSRESALPLVAESHKNPSAGREGGSQAGTDFDQGREDRMVSKR